MSKTSSLRSLSRFLSTENVKLHLSAGSGYATEENGNVKSNFKRRTEKSKKNEVQDFNKGKCSILLNQWMLCLHSAYLEWELLSKSWIYVIFDVSVAQHSGEWVHTVDGKHILITTTNIHNLQPRNEKTNLSFRKPFNQIKGLVFLKEHISQTPLMSLF